jgi:histidine triad (HIT) family protein
MIEADERRLQGQVSLFGENFPKKEQPDCPFCLIANGKDPSRHVVFRDGVSIGFLDRRPVFLGHCLLIPLNHYETLYDLPEELIGPLFRNAKRLGKAVEKGTTADGTFVAINNKISQSVPHLHIHIIPRKSGDGLRGFFWPRRKYESEEQMVSIAESIRKSVSKLSEGSETQAS